MSRAKLRFFLDEGVAISVGKFLETQKHEVVYFHEAATKGSPDQLVCTIAEINDAILVAHDGDMRAFARKAGVSNNRYKSLSLLKLSCSEPMAIQRIKEALPLIEFEWVKSGNVRKRRIFFEVGKSFMKTNR